MTEATKEELLDLFATEAMRLLVERAGTTLNPFQVADVAYTVAERMLERRQKVLQQWKLDEEIKQDSIDKLMLTIRSENCLKSEGILTIQQLQQYTENALMRLPNFGRKSLREVIEQMAAQGFTLKGYK